MVVVEIAGSLAIFWLFFSILYAIVYSFEGQRLSRWNMFGLTRDCAQALADLTLKIRLTSLTEVEKEIREEEKEILIYASRRTISINLQS